MRSRWTLACLLGLLSQSISFAQVTVNFTASNMSGCGTVNAQFTDQSSSTNGSIVSWNWDFDGATSTSQNIGHFFTTPGSYTICLTVTDNQGVQGTLCKDDYIVVHGLPSPNFIADPGSGCQPLTVEFEDNSTASGNIVQWTWGLGGTSGVVVNNDGANVSSTYSLVGNYSVSLTVKDEYGCSNTVTKSNAVMVESPPVIDISAVETFSCYPPFNASFQNNNIQSGIIYEWDFGNGVTYTGATPPSISYNQTGSYTISVLATTSSGCSSTMELEEYIQVGSPASFTYTPEEGCEELTVSFTDTSPAPADSVWWDFGDGTTSTDFNPQHTYESQGCFSVSFIRYNNGGCTTSENSPSCIQVFAKPAITIQLDEDIGCELPHTVKFNASQAGLTEWAWDFGDGTTSTASDPIHDYTAVGSFPVSLMVTNLYGCTQTITTDTIVVFQFQSQLTATDLFGCTPLTVNLSSTNNSLVPVVEWDWRLQNNSMAPAVEVYGIGENPSLILEDTGLYDIRLITTNELECKDTVNYTQEAGVGIPPEISFSADPDTACVNDGITFTDGSSSFANEWNWSFGDGGTSAEQNPNYEYSGLGPYDVTLEAIHHGCANELTEEDFIFINPPLAGFTIQTSCINYFFVTIEDNSTGATSMLYDFGVAGTTSDTSSLTNATYEYSDAGTYTITQIVANDTTGCTDTLQHMVTIGVPIADITLSPTTGCVPLTVQIVDNSNFATDYEYELIEGQGVISDPSSAEPSILFTNTGLYSGLKLMITDLNGCQDSITLNDSIYVNAVTADYALTPIAGCRPLLVSFSDSSSSVFGTVNHWDWTISDVSNGQLSGTNPDFLFENIGSYDVTLTATDDWGCTNTMQITDAVYVTFPDAQFTADTLGCTHSLVDFTSLSQGDGLSYNWSFGDGTTSTAKDPSHLYEDEGIYSVCLTVTDVNGCLHELCKPDFVVIADPVASFMPDATYAACPPLVVNFENNSQNSSSYLWDFGDAGGNSDLVNPANIYTNPGIYTVSLIASSTFKCSDTLTMPDVIIIDGPIGKFHFDKDTACAPAAITFMAESIEAYNYYWDFGDGTIDSTTSVMTDTAVHYYQLAGQYVPKLILEDVEGCHFIIQSPDTIFTASLNVDYIAVDTALCEGEMGTTFINITNSSIPVNFLEWSFEGGDPETSNFDNVGVNYNGAGAFDVQLVVDNGICRDTLIKPDYIGVGSDPVADFSYTPASGCLPLTVQFTDLSTVENSTINQWNWNFVGNGTSNEQNPNPVFQGSNSSLQQIELTVTSALGCTNTSEATIPLLPTPAATIDQVATLCKGEPAVLNPQIQTDTTGMTYSWSGDPSLSCTDCLNPSIALQDTTTFELIITNIFGCTASAFTTVNVLPDSVPSVTLTPDTSICYSNVIQLQATGGDHLDAYQWDATSPGLSCYESCFNPVASPEENTTYYLTVTNQNGCSAIDSVLVEVVNQNASIAGEDRVICRGDSIQLNLEYGNDPEWLIPNHLTCAYCPDPIAFPDVDITYVVEAFTNDGCRIVDTLTIEVMSIDDFDAGEDQIICLGESIFLDGEGEEGSPLWSPDNGLSSATAWKPTLSPTSSTNYLLTVERGDCILTDEVFIQVDEQTVVSGEDITICWGDSVMLEVMGEADTYTWETSEYLSDFNSEAPWAFPEENTTFVATASLSTCTPDTATFNVYVNDIPDIYTERVRYYALGEFIDLLVRPTEDNDNPLSYQWIPAIGLSCSTCTTPTMKPDSSTTISVIATDSLNGCTTQRDVSIEELYFCPEELFTVPNVFSPNGDGANDLLELHLSPSVESIISFQIYDRWGALVFETDDRFAGWDGLFKGRPMNNGVYIYVLQVVCPVDGSVIMKRGDVTILR